MPGGAMPGGASPGGSIRAGHGREEEREVTAASRDKPFPVRGHCRRPGGRAGRGARALPHRYVRGSPPRGVGRRPRSGASGAAGAGSAAGPPVPPPLAVERPALSRCPGTRADPAATRAAPGAARGRREERGGPRRPQGWLRPSPFGPAETRDPWPAPAAGKRLRNHAERSPAAEPRARPAVRRGEAPERPRGPRRVGPGRVEAPAGPEPPAAARARPGTCPIHSAVPPARGSGQVFSSSPLEP
ncbi:uncharacterized protein LOC143694706 [Agelaius phoeniceus]|uniref:uncharacterized protein LOC143694706 n=1 Tax=Agelaius phoeniceus TaxID=39638 RepID=UPI004054E649